MSPYVNGLSENKNPQSVRDDDLAKALKRNSNNRKAIKNFTKKGARKSSASIVEDYYDTLSNDYDLIMEFNKRSKSADVTEFEVQSTDVVEMNSSADKSSTQNIEFNDQDEGEVKSYTPIVDKTFTSSYNASTELGNYLSRPVLIYSDTWLENNDLNQTINPWAAFFTEPAIKRKLDNYAFVSCTMKVKLMINASPFYYGCGLMSYLPLSVFEAGNVAPASGEQLFGVYSQRPHIYFYPQSNQGGELTLPYINYKDWLDLTSVQDMIDFGELSINTLGTLLNANSVAGTGVTVQVYAWAEDVRLAGNTLELSLQSKDEYEDFDGVLSKPASAISKAAKALEQIPVIGPYMTASSFVASKFAETAAWFGFTNTPVITAQMPFSGKPYHAYASPEQSIPVNKLTLDPKNELTIDSRVTGCDGEDHMLIKNICEREAFVFQTSFDSTSSVNTQILAIRVQPNIFNQVVAANQGIIQYTPMAHLSQMFKYWRGDLIYRFQFICSKYHRGRVRFTWDPVSSTSNLSRTSTTNYTKIVDIAETPNFELRIPYQQATSYQNVSRDYENPVYIEDSSFLNIDRDEDNGSLNMRIFTELTSPVANSPCLVFVSVRAADNFELATPNDVPDDIFVYEVQAQDIAVNSTSPEEFFSVDDDDKRNLVYHGETVLSLRQLLRRKVLTRTINWLSTIPTAYAFNIANHPRLPYYPGFDPNGIHTAVSTIDGLEKRYNFVQNTPFTWMRHCYIGNRGSIVWTLNNGNTTDVGAFGYKRLPVEQDLTLARAQRTAVVDVNISMGTRLEMTHTEFDANFSGADFTTTGTWAAVDSLVPMYSKFRMLPNNPATASFGNPKFGTNVDGMQHFAYFSSKTSSTGNNVYNSSTESTSIGPDFSFIYYINVPTMYRYSVPRPAPTQPYTEVAYVA